MRITQLQWQKPWRTESWQKEEVRKPPQRSLNRNPGGKPHRGRSTEDTCYWNCHVLKGTAILAPTLIVRGSRVRWVRKSGSPPGCSSSGHWRKKAELNRTGDMSLWNWPARIDIAILAPTRIVRDMYGNSRRKSVSRHLCSKCRGRIGRRQGKRD